MDGSNDYVIIKNVGDVSVGINLQQRLIHWVLFVFDDMDSYLGAAHVADPSLDQIAHHHRRDWDACGREDTCNSKNILIG